MQIEMEMRIHKEKPLHLRLLPSQSISPAPGLSSDDLLLWNHEGACVIGIISANIVQKLYYRASQKVSVGRNQAAQNHTIDAVDSQIQ
ncbi:hypothetical protein I7I50_09891 [Histoplasma capsulatum G186AR]|uniref:Uncharacterized protein n=1 Tax=Ajellomyces capsulatus TaxID=5037 RepID=A0A8H7Z2U8_AJECA|nr:hypothetical protein I7I52_01129 [Histoplasma capsulatum]QSS68803.1 hypothetical protein I7I50_09891 [Histoplasma capsulatum G186AR]